VRNLIFELRAPPFKLSHDLLAQPHQGLDRHRCKTSSGHSFLRESNSEAYRRYYPLQPALVGIFKKRI
jgi:hypothetical protein